VVLVVERVTSHGVLNAMKTMDIARNAGKSGIDII